MKFNKLLDEIYYLKNFLKLFKNKKFKFKN